MFWNFPDNLNQPFVLLENSKSNPNQTTFLFWKKAGKIKCTHQDQIKVSLVEIKKAQKAGYHLVGYFSYELGYFLQPILKQYAPSQINFPLINLYIFSEVRSLNASEINNFLSPFSDSSNCSFIYDLKVGLSGPEYFKKIKKIKTLIKEGDTYQVNFTTKSHFSFTGGTLNLYKNLRKNQKVEYGGFFNFDEHQILSFSPELFIKKEGTKIYSKPMKGTLKRGSDEVEDKKLKSQLQNEIKTRAENVMIVDLIRNDLGQISNTGSVKVKKLCQIEEYETLFHLTSTVESKVNKDLEWIEILTSLFPCGSVTGAPKINTMKIISQLESEPRGVYSGALGYITPENDFCFNVSIRTCVLHSESKAEMGIGSGIIWDSKATEEYKETLLKAQFLTNLNLKFRILESLLLQEDGNILYLEEHLERMQKSAFVFGFPFSKNVFQAKLIAFAEDVTSSTEHKLRVELSLSGEFEINYKPILQEKQHKVSYIKISHLKVDKSDIFRFHKTTRRNLFEKAQQLFKEEDLYDFLFLNREGELTEASRHNVFIQKKNIWYTPPVDVGLLNGIMRQKILSDTKKRTKIQVLKPEDLEEADAIYLTNSVRGIVQVHLKS